VARRPLDHHLTNHRAVFNHRARRLSAAVPDLGRDAAGDSTALNARSKAAAQTVAAARQVLEALRGLPALAGVRNPAALANLPEPERQT
jgi:hypothetical protein